MCGIIGYVGAGDAREHLLTGLRTLEYRGYDSAGVALFAADGTLHTVKAQGKIDALEGRLASYRLEGAHCGIGHTRWATHGEPSDANAHPHGTARVQLVHNGIIENFAALKRGLLAEGAVFHSDTDTEVASLLIDRLYEACAHDACKALRMATRQLQGAYAFAVVFADKPGEIYAVRKESPLVVAADDRASLLASDVTALLPFTRTYYRMEEGEIAHLTQSGVTFYAEDGTVLQKEAQTASEAIGDTSRGTHAHFMHKEIAEESHAVRATLLPRVKDALPCFDGDALDLVRLANARHLYLVACGTAMHAGLLGKYFFARLARMPLSVQIASEFRYSDPLLSEEDAVLLVSQSGETADTLAALRLSKARGAYTVGIVNAPHSAIAREADDVLYTHAGPEIAVASTKAYTVQSALLALLAAALSREKEILTQSKVQETVRALCETLPHAIDATIAREDEIYALAETVKDAAHLFFIGRQADSYAATEASLKMKEISYIHSEAYAAGELKHGTISLIEQGTPVVALMTDAALAAKTANGCKEVMARGARVIAFCTEQTYPIVSEITPHAFCLPICDPVAAPIAIATALQLFAYRTALLRSCDVDRPRNLAKSVTVE